MEPQKAAANPITEGVIWKQLLTFFFPIMIGTFFQQLYNTADAVIVGQYLGKTALAATGGTSSVLINLLVMFFINLSSGASVVISQYYGARKEKELKDTLHTAIALALTGGLILSVIGVSCTPAVLRFLHSPEDVQPLAVIYLRVYFSGMITVLVYNIGSAILRAVGDSRRPLHFLIVACFINILLDLLFVAVFHFGIAGAAAATVIAQGISAVLVLRTLLTTQDIYKLTWKDIRFHPALLKRILFIGFPAGLQASMFNISNIIIQSTLNGFGTDIVAAWTAFNKLDVIFWMGSNAFGVSIMTFSGQNYGAGKFDRIRKSCRICLGMFASYSAVLSVLFALIGGYGLLLFTSDPSVLHYGRMIMMTMTPFYITYIFVETYSGAIRGTGNTLIPMLITCFGVCVLRVLWIFLYIPGHHTVRAVVSSYPITWAFTSLLFILYYFRGNWLKH